MNDSLKNQVTVITGAASGLGLAAAKKLSAEGAQLALPDINTGPLEKIKRVFAQDIEVYC